MLLVLPVSKHDLHLSFDLLHVIESFGKCDAHDLLVASRPSCVSACDVLTDRYFQLFKSVHLAVLESDGPEGWPQGANDIFMRTAVVAQTLCEEKKTSWFFVEPDCIPLTEEWLDAIEMDHAANGKKFTGNLVSYGENADGNHFNGGCWVQPWNASKLLPLNKLDTAVDYVHRKFILEHGNATELIQNCYRSTEFHYGDDGRIQYRDEHGNIDSINKNAVIIHGCKDGSLHNLIINQKRKQ